MLLTQITYIPIYIQIIYILICSSFCYLTETIYTFTFKDKYTYIPLYIYIYIHIYQLYICTNFI